MIQRNFKIEYIATTSYQIKAQCIALDNSWWNQKFQNYQVSYSMSVICED